MLSFYIFFSVFLFLGLLIRLLLRLLLPPLHVTLQLLQLLRLVLDLNKAQLASKDSYNELLKHFYLLCQAVLTFFAWVYWMKEFHQRNNILENWSMVKGKKETKVENSNLFSDHNLIFCSSLSFGPFRGLVMICRKFLLNHQQ